MDGLVTTEWLAGELGAPDLVVLDASYTSTIPGSPPGDPLGDYRAGHIPGALFLGLDDLVDKSDPLPSMLPPASVFAARMEALGIGNDRRIVLYEAGPHHTACRAWWVLRMFGVEKIALLDGALAKWRAEGRPLESGEPAVEPRPFAVRPAIAEVRDLAAMRANVKSGAEQVADARSAARFTGAEPDPRSDCAAGHIPGSRNIPSGSFFRADGTWKRGAELQAVFDAAGIDITKPLIATCGSGITAAIIAFGAHLLGRDAALYDGSWSEWGADPSTPKAVGAA